METILEQLELIFRQVFDNPEIIISPITTANDVDGWDSLSHINLIMAVEQHFQIEFTYRELASLKTVGDLARIIVEKNHR